MLYKTIIFICIICIISSCTKGEDVQKYTSCKIGDQCIVKKDLVAISYDFTKIPLVKPGIQFFDIDEKSIKTMPSEFKAVKIGVLKRGDHVEIDSFVEEGGWIPCKGIWFMSNPMVVVKSGELSGKTVGISLLCDFQIDKPVIYKTGKFGFMKVNSQYLETQK